MALILSFVAASPAGAAVTPIWGKVFLDTDRDGTWDGPGEAGISGVGVSNGTTVLITPTGGTFTTTADLTLSRFVWITVPSGYRATTPFYQKVHWLPTTDSLYFGLIPDASLADGPFTFAQISDSEIQTPAGAAQLEEGLTELAAAHPSPSFLVVTGDLVIDGDRTMFGLYREAIETLSIPVHNVYGNHDRTSGAVPTLAYEDSLGPSYYSFEHFGCHFVVLNSMDPPVAQAGWLTNDVATLGGPGKRLIILRHSPPARSELDQYVTLGADMVVSGHWHVNRERLYRGILDVVTPPITFAGIDRTPRGFRLLHVTDTSITTEFRVGGQSRSLTVVSPQAGSTVQRGMVPIRVNAYDTSIRVTSVDVVLSGPSGSLLPFHLTREGSRSWKGMWSASQSPPGTWTVSVTARDEGGAVWNTVSTFTVSGAPAPVISTGENWRLFHGDVLHQGLAATTVTPPLVPVWISGTGAELGLSSPVIRNRVVYVGTGKGDDFQQCGVRAYDVGTGGLIWSRTTSSSVVNTVSADDQGVIAVGVTGVVNAWDPSTGAPRWSATLGDTASRYETSSPGVAGGVVYAGRAPHMEALSVSSGVPIWVSPPAGMDFLAPDFPAPAVSAGRAVFGTSSGLFGLNATSGAGVWSTPGFFRTATIRDTVVYAVGGTVFTNQYLSARRVSTGGMIWSSGIDLHNGASSPAVSGTTIVVGSGYGEVRAFNSTNGTLRWTFMTGSASASTTPYVHSGGDVASSPAISGSTVYVGATDGILYALDLATGSEKWRFEIGAPIRSSPAVSGNAVFVTADDGCLYAFARLQGATSVDGGPGEDDGGRAPGIELRIPSPLRPGAEIHFRGPAGTMLELTLHDVTGRTIRSLFRGRTEGEGTLTWDGTDGAGRRVAPGVYFATLQGGGHVTRTKVITTGG